MHVVHWQAPLCRYSRLKSIKNRKSGSCEWEGKSRKKDLHWRQVLKNCNVKSYFTTKFYGRLGFYPTDQFWQARVLSHWLIFMVDSSFISLTNFMAGSGFIPLTNFRQVRVLSLLTNFHGRFGFYPTDQFYGRFGFYPTNQFHGRLWFYLTGQLLRLVWVLFPLKTFICLLVSVRSRITTGKYLVSTSLFWISSKLRQRGASCRHQNFNSILMLILFYF